MINICSGLPFNSFIGSAPLGANRFASRGTSGISKDHGKKLI